MSTKTTNKGARAKHAFAQSTYITTGWNWFLILAGKAAEPVLVMSVLYASVKLLPIVHFPPQFDVVVFIAQFVALDVGGLSLNKLADQAKKDGNDEGAKHARRLSIALVGIMLVGVIMAGVDQIVKLDGQVGTVIDTILLIARAVMAVLYSRVIHSLKKDEPETPAPDETEVEDLVHETVERVVTEAVARALAETVTTLRQELVSHLDVTLSQHLEEQATAINETMTTMVELEVRKQAAAAPKREPRPRAASNNVRSITEAASRKRAAAGGTQEVDKVIWPLLNTGMTVRAIATRANTSTATVGRSRQRWEAAQKNVSHETDIDGETAEA